MSFDPLDTFAPRHIGPRGEDVDDIDDEPEADDDETP